MGPHLAKTIFFVNPTRRVPVGILPDFMADERKDEEYAKLVDILYYGFRNERGILVGPFSTLFEGAPSS